MSNQIDKKKCEEESNNQTNCFDMSMSFHQYITKLEEKGTINQTN